MKRPDDSHVNGRCSCGVYRGQRHNPKCPYDDPGPRDMAYDSELSDAQALHKLVGEAPIPTTREEPFECSECGSKGTSNRLIRNFSKSNWICERCHRKGKEVYANPLEAHAVKALTKEVKENPARPDSVDSKIKAIKNRWDDVSEGNRERVAYIEKLEKSVKNLTIDRDHFEKVNDELEDSFQERTKRPELVKAWMSAEYGEATKDQEDAIVDFILGLRG